MDKHPIVTFCGEDQVYELNALVGDSICILDADPAAFLNPARVCNAQLADAFTAAGYHLSTFERLCGQEKKWIVAHQVTVRFLSEVGSLRSDIEQGIITYDDALHRLCSFAYPVSVGDDCYTGKLLLSESQDQPQLQE